MNMLLFFTVIGIAAIIFTIMNKLGRSKHPFKKSILTMISGLAGLTAVNMLSGITMVSVPISITSLLIAVIGGLPGVTLMVSLNAFF